MSRVYGAQQFKPLLTPKACWDMLAPHLTGGPGVFLTTVYCDVMLCLKSAVMLHCPVSLKDHHVSCSSSLGWEIWGEREARGRRLGDCLFSLKLDTVDVFFFMNHEHRLPYMVMCFITDVRWTGWRKTLESVLHIKMPYSIIPVLSHERLMI